MLKNFDQELTETMKEKQYMKAILFGSVGSIAETSEIQRASFNEAFTQHGLSWHWEQTQYAAMLERSGGIRRLEEFARRDGITIDAAAIHQSKFEIFKRKLESMSLQPRPGVLEVIAWANANQVKVGLVTTTYRNTLEAVVEATEGLSMDDFDVTTDVDSVEQRKPASDCYQKAILELSLTANECVAVEDNVDGYTASQLAGVTCYCCPGENTRLHRFPDSAQKVPQITPAILGAELV
ncbi:MAG: HAD-IA family hydrolase [Planctomycetota bacterium]